jgi:hypothetical protein
MWLCILPMNGVCSYSGERGRRAGSTGHTWGAGASSRFGLGWGASSSPGLLIVSEHRTKPYIAVCLLYYSEPNIGIDHHIISLIARVQSETYIPGTTLPSAKLEDEKTMH